MISFLSSFFSLKLKLERGLSGLSGLAICGGCSHCGCLQFFFLKENGYSEAPANLNGLKA